MERLPQPGTVWERRKGSDRTEGGDSGEGDDALEERALREDQGVGAAAR